MQQLTFTGTRRQAFTLDSPSEGAERRYYVEPGQPVTVIEKDATLLLERDPDLWERYEEPVEVKAEAAAEDKPSDKAEEAAEPRKRK